MAPSLMALGVALTALLGGAHTMAVDGARSLSCCGRATFDLNSEDVNFHSTPRVNDQDTTMDLTGSNQKSSIESPQHKDDGEEKRNRTARSIKEVLQIVQSNGGDQREPIQISKSELASKRSILNQQMNEEGAMRHGLWNRDLFYSTKSPVPPEPLVDLSRLTESLAGTLEHKPVDQKSLEIALKLKNCNKGKQKLDQTYYLM